MSYDTLKKMSINLKELMVKYSYSPNNVTDWKGNKVAYDCEKKFETKEKLEDWLLCLVEGHYDGVSPISSALTLYKRVMWLEENGLITEQGIPVDSEEVRKILTGEKKVKPKMYIMKNDYGYLKRLKYGVRLQPWGKASKLYKQEVEAIKHYHADFLERNGVYVEEVG